MIARVLVPGLEQMEILGFGHESTENAAKTNLLMTYVAQVKQLKPDQINRGTPAKIRGIVVGVRPVAFMLQDSTGGISVHYNPVDWTDQPQTGDLLEVEGVTGSGVFAPAIIARSIKRLGNTPMPEPIHPRWDQLMNGSLDCEYVEIQGILTAVSGTELSLFSAEGTLHMNVDGNGIEDLSSSGSGPAPNQTLIAGELVRLRGCCMPSTDSQARQVIHGRIQLNCPLIAVEEMAPKDPFALPTKRIAELLWFDPRVNALQRTKLTGQIIHVQTGEYMALEDQHGFRILTPGSANFEVGDLIEAVGFPKLDGPSPVLQQAQVRKTGHAPLPAPVPVSADKLLNQRNDSTLIQVEAVLIGEASRSQQEYILELQAGTRHFLAVQRVNSDLYPKLVAGSRLRLVGVYASASRLETSTDPFSLLLVDGADAVTVIKRPSWWTAPHALIIAAILAGALGLASVWITMLRQKVEMRTAQLRKEIQERERAEKDQAIGQERTRVAQDLHDELGAGLTTVGLLGELIKNPLTPAEKKTGYLEQITHTAHLLVTALDEIVWAINPQNDSIDSSANYYAYFAQPFVNAAGIACRLDISKNLAERPLDPRLRHGVFLAFKEALNNVVRHSGATEVMVKILTQDEQLVIAVRDNGNGMDASRKPSGPGQDGVSGMRDRLRHLGGTCLINRQPGRGTTVEFHIPLAQPFFNRAGSAATEPPPRIGEKL